MGIGEDIKNEAETAGQTTLRRLLLWIEKEAHLAGADIEVEITSIMSKLERKPKNPR
jgi:hypothetical protein